MVHMTADDMLGAIEDHARDGMDFVTVHCGVTREVAEHCRARTGWPTSSAGAGPS